MRCKICKKEFRRITSSVYCSKECRSIWQKEQNQKDYIKYVKPKLKKSVAIDWKNYIKEEIKKNIKPL